MFPGIAPKPAAPMAAQPKKPAHMLVLGTSFVGRTSPRASSRRDETTPSSHLRRVSGTCTSAAKKTELEMLGMSASVFDATRSKNGTILVFLVLCSVKDPCATVFELPQPLANLDALQDATHLLTSISPIPGIGDPSLSLHTDLQTTLTDGNLQWLCYLSSTSVYGDCGGAWVDEDHTVNPKSESAKLRYTAEKGWLIVIDELDLSAFIFRLRGIYGPGRSALDTIAKNKSLSQGQKLRESKQFNARIHVADIYQAILASMSIRQARKIYNMVDDDPAPRAEVFAFAQNLIERRYPDSLVDSTGSNSQDRIIAAEKRVSNARLKQELGVRLVHPTYKSGLQSISDSWLPESAILRETGDA